MTYRDKVFKDVAKALGNSTRINLSSDENQKQIDGLEGLELLSNFNLLFKYYDELRPYMKKAVKEIKEKKKKGRFERGE